MLGDSRRGSGGFCRARATLRGHGSNRGENGVGGRKKVSAAGTAIDGGDGGRYTSDEVSQKNQRGRQSSYVVRARENRENPKRRKGAHPKQRSRGGAPAHLSQHRGSERNECEARRPG